MLEIIGEVLFRLVIGVISFFVELAYNIAHFVFSLTKGRMWVRILISVSAFFCVLGTAYWWLFH
ncbi:hypothetical protein KGP17_06850 [Serratia sp. JSRIV001]|uniref:hypothetical protein n=1 Tax=Serratia sp. JSRIV001 TaxID=2831893 RepID=UPI001CBF8595|nr:hypothetical protein [Serratia sp. JSRIV001]UAN47247.1 hypothetical protein KGP17_06850 [Serratia sp. JSRIV001]